MSTLIEESEKLKEQISKFCRARINSNICNDDECEFCPVNDAYEMAENPSCEEENTDEDSLPESVIVDLHELDMDSYDSIEDAVSDYLSDTYGFCHKGFSIDYVSSLDETATVSNIIWDTEVR